MVFQNSHNINPGFLQTVSAAHRDSLSAFSNACSGKYNTETLTRILRLYLTALVLNVRFLACVRANKDKAEPGERPGETLASSGRHSQLPPQEAGLPHLSTATHSQSKTSPSLSQYLLSK